MANKNGFVALRLISLHAKRLFTSSFSKLTVLYGKFKCFISEDSALKQTDKTPFM